MRQAGLPLAALAVQAGSAAALTVGGPLPRDASDQDRVDAFIRAASGAAAQDLRAFFAVWGLPLSEAAQAGWPDLPPPAVDPATLTLP